MKKTRLNRLKFKKNQPVRLRFYNPETKKTEPNRTRTEKIEKTEPNRKKNLAKTEPNKKTEPNQFEPVFVLKNRTGPKPVGLNRFQFFF